MYERAPLASKAGPGHGARIKGCVFKRAQEFGAGALVHPDFSLKSPARSAQLGRRKRGKIADFSLGAYMFGDELVGAVFSFDFIGDAGAVFPMGSPGPAPLAKGFFKGFGACVGIHIGMPRKRERWMREPDFCPTGGG